MTRPGFTQAAILAVGAIILFGVHKSDQDTQARINHATQTSGALTFELCIARNKAIIASNIKWARLATFIDETASLPGAAQYRAKWEAYANTIQPLPTAQCGKAP